MGWIRSNRCGSTTCVEVNGDNPEFIRVRDSKEVPADDAPDVPPPQELRFTRQEWGAIIGAVTLAKQRGALEFDILVQSNERAEPVQAGVTYLGEIGLYAFTDRRQGAVLLYSKDEMEVFVDGAPDGAYNVPEQV